MMLNERCIGKLFFTLSIFCITIVHVQSSTPEYDVSGLCGRSVSVHSSTLLRADRVMLSGTCSFSALSTLHTTANNTHNNKLRLQLLSLQMECGSGFLQLFDGNQNMGGGTRLSGPLCGDDRTQQTTMYMSAMNNFITINVQSHSTAPVSFLLLATATSLFPESKDFTCSNHFAVDQSLQCDGYNNCGDWSDENDDLCHVTSRTLVMGLVILVSTVAVNITVIVAVICCYRKRNKCSRMEYRQATPKAGLSTPGTSSYGSIQRGPATDYIMPLSSPADL